MKDQTRIIIGFFIILLGVGLLIQQTGLGDISIVNWVFQNLWPLFLIALGVSFFSQGNRNGGIVFTILGFVFLASTVLGWSVWAILWPLVIIGAGILVLFRGNLFGGSKVKVSGDKVDASVVFWGAEKKLKGENYKGGNINCVFGGVEYDMKEVKIDKAGAEINVTLMFGGVELRIPENTKVINNITALLGGVEEKHEYTDKPSGTLTLTGSVLFGGVEIRN